MDDKLLRIAEESAKGGFSLFLGDFTSTAILALGSIIVARLLGPSDYGIYALTLVIPSIIISLIDLGIDSALIRFPSKFRIEGEGDKTAGIIKSAIIFKLLLGTTLASVTFFSSNYLATSLLNRPEVSLYLQITSISILFQTIYNSTYNAFIGLDAAEKGSLIKILMSITKTSLAPILIIGLGITGAVLGHIFSVLTAGTAGLILLLSGPYKKLKSQNSNKKFLLDDVKLMIRYALPIYVSSLLAIFLIQYQLIILAHYTTNSEIGNFNVATNLSALITVMITPIATSLFPAFSKLNSVSGDEELNRFFNHSVKYSSLLITPASIIVILLAKDIVDLVYGGKYGLAHTYLPLYCVLFLFLGLGYRVLESLLNGIGKTRYTLKTYIANLLVFIPFAPILTQIYGVPGLISAYLASNLTQTVYGLILVRKKLQLKLDYNEQLKIYLSSAISAAPLLLIKYSTSFGNVTNLILGGAVYAITYITVTPIMGAIEVDDLKNLEMVLKKIRLIGSVFTIALRYEKKILRTIKLLRSH